ncbi:ELMO domain-containing protein B, partial [Cucurbita argyrosperma subsp. argyrosperma]
LVVNVANAMVGPRSWIGGIFNRSGNKKNDKFQYPLSPLQEERLQRLQDRIHIPYDEMCIEHQVLFFIRFSTLQEALRALWDVAFPDVELKGLISEQWKEMGWQGANPSTDFRGCGFISLENLLFFSRTFPASFRRLLWKEGGNRATWEYPFAVAGINISYMLIQMLDLKSGMYLHFSTRIVRFNNGNDLCSRSCYHEPNKICNKTNNKEHDLKAFSKSTLSNTFPSQQLKIFVISSLVYSKAKVYSRTQFYETIRRY